MSKETWIGRKGLRYWYYKYRDSEYLSLVIMISTVGICLLLIFNVIVPQVTTWFSIREEVAATEARIATIEQNISFMNNLDRNELNNQLLTATKALPTEKDFGTMLNVISESAVTSGVSMNDFSFQVGNVASSAAGLGLVNDSQHKGLASIKITVVAIGTIDGIKRFINTVEKSVPVSEVVNIDGTGQTISLSLQFYQKAIPEINIQPDKPISRLTASNLALLQSLATWKESEPLPSFDFNTATGGALPLF